MTSCAETDFLVDRVGDISVSNPFGEMGLEIVWDVDRCPHLTSITVRVGDAGHELIAECANDARPDVLPLYLTLSEPLPAEFFHAYLTAAPGASPVPTPTLPPPVIPSATPDPHSNPRDRIDQFWESFGDVDCVGMGAPESIDTVAGWADVIVTARPTGAQPWGAGPYSGPNSLVTLDVTNVIKGEANVRAGDVLQLYATLLPTAIVSDIDHLLFLNVLNRDQRVYYLTDNFLTVFANVDGRVVTPEYAAVKKVEGTDLYSVRLDGTKFDDLVDRIRSDSDGTKADQEFLLRAYFAC